MGKTALILGLLGAGGLGWLGAHAFENDGDLLAMAGRRAASSPEFETLHEGLRVSDYLRSEIEARGGTTIPVLVPYEMTVDAAAAEAHAFRLRLSPGDYTALLKDEAYDYLITGTASSHSSGSESDSADEDSAPETDDYMRPYEDFDDGRGGSLAFGFRGADYQVEIYCLNYDPESDANCMEASFVENLVIDLTGG